MVERCVRDAEVVGSNPVASTTHRKSETNWFSGFLFAILVVMQQQKGKEKLTDQERFMKEAIRQAKKAEALEEVPIGCVIVHEGKIIARGYNRRNTDKNTLSHAELNAIRKASKKLGDWRLEGCTMYVTLEPCQMCSGALVQSRIDEVLHAIHAARNLIRESKTYQLPNIMQTNRKMGMMTMDDAIVQLYFDGVITRDMAIQYAQAPENMYEKLF